MALSAPWHSAALPSGLADRHQRQRAFQAARRHSRLVRRLRIALPAAGSLVVLAFVVTTHFALPDDFDLSAARLSVTPNSIIMDNPHLKGFDGDEREYTVEADRAIQALINPDAVRLEAIKGTVKTAGKGTATFSAGLGDYDHGESTLKLRGGIAMQSSEGYALRMHDADLDFRTGTMGSPNPATVTFGDFETTGQSISVTGGGNVIVFEGGVRTTLMPPKRTPAAVAPR